MNTYFKCVNCGFNFTRMDKECPKCHKDFIVEIDTETDKIIAKYKKGEKYD